MKFIQHIRQYFIDQLPTATRHMHYLIILFVLFQFLISGGMHVSSEGIIYGDWFSEFASWAHFIIGLLLVPLAIIFYFVALKVHGFRYFYPYLYGDLSQIKADFKELTHLRLPETHSGGIATSVQGLGLGALMLVVLSGLWWFILWYTGSDFAGTIRDVHKALTNLVGLYLIGHGGLGVIHILVTFMQKKAK